MFWNKFSGLEKVAADCKKLNVSFHLLEGSGAEVLPQWVEKHNIGAVVCDFNPLRVPLGWLEGCKKKLKKDVPLIQVCIFIFTKCRFLYVTSLCLMCKLCYC